MGIDVCGLEWSYGSVDDGTGIFFVVPQTSTIGKFKESVLIGETVLNDEQILDALQRLSTKWKGSQYHLLKKNCLIFSQDFLSELCPGKKLPSWTTSTAFSLRPLAPLIAASPKRAAISTSVTKVVNDRMWQEARVRMQEYHKWMKQSKTTGHVNIPKVIHANQPHHDHNIDETINYTRQVRDVVTMNYSRYAKSFIR